MEEVLSTDTVTDSVHESVSDFSQHLLMIEEQLASDPDNQALISVRNDIIQFLELANPQATGSVTGITRETDTQFAVGDKYSIQCTSYAGDLASRNCIIMELDSSTNSAVVLFTHPTDESLIPCRYFLDGNCKFESECRRSHGYRVDTSLLETYEDYDLSQAQEDSACLVYSEDSGLWTPGIILKKIEDICEVWLEKSNEKAQVPINEILLLKTPPKDLYSSGEDSEYEYRTIPILPTPSDNSSIGREAFWEKHTRGIGSKLMSKMGYIPGTGLGVEGNGMRDPVEIVVLPKRRSLDQCMESKRNSTDSKVRRKTIKKKYIKRNIVNNGSTDSVNLDVFDFLNNSIQLQQLVHSEISSREHTQVSLNNSARKDRNRVDVSGGRRVQLDKQLRDAKTEVDKLRLSLSRNRKDPVIAQQIEIKLRRVETDLFLMEQEESSILSRLNSKKKRASMSVF